MKLTKYLTALFLKISIVITIFLTIIFHIIDYIEKSRNLPQSIPSNYILKWISLNAVFTFYLMIPVATVISITIILAGMNEKNEFVALLGAGAPLKIIFKILLEIGIGVAIFQFLLGEFVVPSTVREAQQVYYSQIKHLPYKFSKLDKIWIQGTHCICRIGFLLPHEKAIRDLTIIKFDDQLNITQMEQINFATFIKNKWLFFNDKITNLRRTIPDSRFTKWQIGEDFPYSFRSLNFLKKTPQEMNFTELYRYIRILKSKGYVSPYLIAGLIIKVVIPISTLFLFLIPLGMVKITPRNKKIIRDFFISVTTGFLYLGGTMMAFNGIKGFNPVISATFPLFIVTIFLIPSLFKLKAN